jgi:hypothetical protein
MSTLRAISLAIVAAMTSWGQERPNTLPAGIFDKTIYLAASPQFEAASYFDEQTHRLSVQSELKNGVYAPRLITCRVGSMSYRVPNELFTGLTRMGVATHIFKYDTDSIAFVITCGDGESALNCCFKLNLASKTFTREDWTKFGQLKGGSKIK